MLIKAVPFRCMECRQRSALLSGAGHCYVWIGFWISGKAGHFRYTDSRKPTGGKMKNAVTDQDVEDAYRIAAGIVRDFGDQYLPIFKRLYQERAARKENSNLKNIALQIAKPVAD